MCWQSFGRCLCTGDRALQCHTQNIPPTVPATVLTPRGPPAPRSHLHSLLTRCKKPLAHAHMHRFMHTHLHVIPCTHVQMHTQLHAHPLHSCLCKLHAHPLHTHTHPCCMHTPCTPRAPGAAALAWGLAHFPACFPLPASSRIFNMGDQVVYLNICPLKKDVSKNNGGSNPKMC